MNRVAPFGFPKEYSVDFSTALADDEMNMSTELERRP
jgi:hypothetical protein